MTVQEVVCEIMVSAFFSTVVVQMQYQGYVGLTHRSHEMTSTRWLIQVKSLTDIKNENAVNIQHCDAKGGVDTFDVISVQTLSIFVIG